MSYIWEDYTPERKYRRQKHLTPYFETTSSSRHICEVNPLLRFSEINNAMNIYGEIEYENTPKDDEDQFLSTIEPESVENIIFHFLALQDLESGLDKQQIKMNYLDREIMEGYFGPEIKAQWKKINSAEKNIILYFLTLKIYNQYTSFTDILIKFFAEASLLEETFGGEKKYFLYIGEKKTEYRHVLVKAIEYLFWNYDKILNVVWEHHYGVIGWDQTMKIDSISIV